MTQYGSNPGSFNTYHFSGVNTFNQESQGISGTAAFPTTPPYRVTDINVFWDGDGSAVTGNNMMWNGDGTIFIQSSQYTSNVGSESVGGQHLHTTSHNVFFSGYGDNTMWFGYFRNKTASSVASTNTSGTDGFTQTTSSNSPSALSGRSSFTSAYGSAGKGNLRAYINVVPSSVFIKRGGVWTAVSVDVKRLGVMGAAKVWVRRAGAWVQLAMVPVNDWGSEIEKQVKILWTDGTWDNGIIRDGEMGIVTIGNYDPKSEPQSKRIYIPQLATA